MSQSTEDLKGLLEKVLSEGEGMAGLTVHEVRISSCTKPGDNFMSAVSAVEVDGTLPGGTPYKKSVFVKRPVGGAEHTQTYRIDDAFSNETVMYQQVLPLYGVTSPCPWCYYAGSDVIVLEDLRLGGYVMGERRAGFDLSTAQHVLKALARLHAGSYHAKLTNKANFSTAISQLKPIGFVLSQNKDMVETSLQRAINMVAGVEDVKDVLPVLRNFQGRVTEIMRDLRKTEKITVVTHGDFWLNNLMVHKGSNDPVKIVDLQACSVSSPAVDVWTFLYTSIAPSFMESGNFNQLLWVYITSFLEHLEDLKIPAHHTPSSTEFLSELKSKELYGFFAGTMYLPALELTANVPDFDSISKEQTLDDDFALQFFGPELKSRIRNLVRLCKERGVFENL
uniref:CHK kinase-like domain-containing protein n=1 Tax=Graphocephala atropunctata TaxID=36148 RepID=A0A1B6LRZ6_9HEMI